MGKIAWAAAVMMLATAGAAEAPGCGMFMIADSVFSKKYMMIPEGEFWDCRKFGAYDVKDMSGIAHLYGKKIASAEAMTSLCEIKSNALPSSQITKS